MGIPSYFSYIIKNYSNIIRSLTNVNADVTCFHHLFMDCNSIIYDSFRNIEQTQPELLSNIDELETTIINQVVRKISDYLLYIRPTTTAFIAFDGVAPFAKMDQQRNRRYKGSVLAKMNSHVKQSTPDRASWSTSNITPGTNFMRKLGERVTSAFKGLESHYKVTHLIVSTSESCGEGEHKMFQYMRQHKMNPTDACAVYGLDSDLIMLSVFHCTMCKNMFIFRETPEFGQQFLPQDMKQSAAHENTCLFMDIHALSRAILSEMQCGNSDPHRIYDYVFLCFFLGNDFLPHFPSLNIRTTGIDTLLDTYRKFIGNEPDRFFISRSMQIQWKWVSLFVQHLAKYEHARLISEYDLRAKWSKRTWLVGTEPERDFTLQSVPVIYRSEELYICPQETHWEHRYYTALFEPDVSRQDVCLNYLQGLQWVFSYYTNDCIDWKWKYHSHYPPLLTDLTKHVPVGDFDFFTTHNNTPFSPSVQLAYVLPQQSYHLLPVHVRDDMLHKWAKYSVTDFPFQWAFCRYFWEAHAILPTIPITVLDTWEKVWGTTTTLPKKRGSKR
jgi:5'-3' exonuclease